MGLPTPLCKNLSQLPPDLEVEVRVEAIGTGDLRATTPSLRDPCVLRGAGRSLALFLTLGRTGWVADMAPARRTIPRINLQRVLRVDSWNVLSLSEAEGGYGGAP